MKKLYIYNKRNLSQLIIFSFAFSILIVIFMLYFSFVRYYDKSIEIIDNSGMQNFILVKNTNVEDQINNNIIKKIKENKYVKNIFAQVFPDFKITEKTGLYSVPQLIDKKFTDYFPIEIEGSADINSLIKLPKDNYYVILSHMSSLKVGEKTTVFDNFNKKNVVLHAIARAKEDSINLNFSRINSNTMFIDLIARTNNVDYIIVDNIHENNFNKFYANSFFLEYNGNDINEINDEENFLLNEGLEVEKESSIYSNTIKNRERTIFLNLNFVLVFFLVFTLLFINTIYLNNVKYNRRNIIYRKLGATKKEIILCKVIANILSLLVGILISWLIIKVIIDIKPEFIFMRDNLLFDRTLYIWTLLILFVYIIISIIVHAISVKSRKVL